VHSLVDTVIVNVSIKCTAESG